MQPLIVVPANDIDAAGLELAAELPTSWLAATLEDAEARATDPGTLTGRLSRSGKADIVVRCKVAVDLTVPCARCLGPAPVSVRTELSLLLKPRAAATPGPAGAERAQRGGKGRKAVPAKGLSTPRAHALRNAEYEFGAAEADLDEYDGERVVLDDFVREAILLELPSFPLCSETCQPTPVGSLDVAADHPGAQQAAGGSGTEETARPETTKHNPFEVLRHLIPGSPLPSAETAGNAPSPRGGPVAGNGRSPTHADLRRITRAKNKGKPKIRSSALHRGKK